MELELNKKCINKFCLEIVDEKCHLLYMYMDEMMLKLILENNNPKF